MKSPKKNKRSPLKAQRKTKQQSQQNLVKVENQDPCACCKEFYLRKYNTSQLKAMLSDNEMQISHTAPIAFCDDAHISPYAHYKNMLKDERHQFEKILKITEQENKTQENKEETNVLGEVDLNRPQQPKTKVQSQEQKQKLKFSTQKDQEIRTTVINEMIIQMGTKLKQSQKTIHLAVKLYDIVCIHQHVQSALQLEFGKHSLLKSDPKNDPKNLRFLAAQSLVLASKYSEVTRLYPAEIVYQVKGWGETEFEVLRGGQIEEYILNIIDFDLMFLTAIDFIDFYTGVWNCCLPVSSCKVTTLSKSQLGSCVQSKIRACAIELCNLMIKNLGQQSSIKYLPSQVAFKALQKSIEITFNQQEGLSISQTNQLLVEAAKIAGVTKNDASEELDLAIQSNKYLQQLFSKLNNQKTSNPNQEISSKNIVMRNNPTKTQRIQLQSISQVNLDKFEKHLCQAQDVEESWEVYPRFELTNLEKGLKITNDFFRGQYINTSNGIPKIDETIENLNLKQMHFNNHLTIREIEKLESPLKVVLKKNVQIQKNKPTKTKKEDKENVNVNFKKHKIAAPNNKVFGDQSENQNPFMSQFEQQQENTEGIQVLRLRDDSSLKESSSQVSVMSNCKYDGVSLSTPSEANNYESNFAKRFMKEQKLDIMKNQGRRQETEVIDHTTDDAYLRTVAHKYGFAYDDMDPTIPSLSHFDEDQDEAESLLLRKKIVDQFDARFEEAQFQPLRRRGRAQQERLDPHFSSGSKSDNSFNQAKTPDNAGFKNAFNYRAMDDEVEVNYQEYKFAFDELQSLDDNIPVTRIPTAETF